MLAYATSMDNDLRRMQSAPSSQENTPLQGEHFPRNGGGLTRTQLFGPLIAALAIVGAVYGWSLRAPRTIAGLRAGGQPVGGVAFGALEGALDKVADGYLGSRSRSLSARTSAR